MTDADLVTRNALIVDATGQAQFMGEIAIKGGKIGSVNTFEGSV